MLTFNSKQLISQLDYRCRVKEQFNKNVRKQNNLFLDCDRSEEYIEFLKAYILFLLLFYVVKVVRMFRSISK